MKYYNISDIDIEFYSECSCGAITLTINGNDYSVFKRYLHDYFPNIDLRKCKRKKLTDTYACNHCVNHYGVDLCACGGGEKIGKCKNEFNMCNQPMQIVGYRTRVSARDGWL